MIEARHAMQSSPTGRAMYDRIVAGTLPEPDWWDIQDPVLDADLSAMSIAEELGGWISALDVRRLPLHWIGSAQTRIRVRQLANERASKRGQS
jgi:hypothetical protein